MKLALLEHFESLHFDICHNIDITGQLSDDDKAEIIKISKEFIKQNMKN